MKKTSQSPNYDSIISSMRLRRSQRDSLYNYIMTLLPSEHMHIMMRFCDEALLEAYKNGQYSSKNNKQ